MANKLFNYLVILILVLISFVIGFNSGKMGGSKQSTANPTWWMAKAVNDSLSYFYGTSTAVSEDIALHRAESRALASVVDYINAELGVEESDGTTGYSQKIVISKMLRTNSLIIELPSKGIYKAYVQMQIPVEIIEKLTDEGVE